MTVDAKVCPTGGKCASGRDDCPLKGMDEPHYSSNWFGKLPHKICRACYGKTNQRKGSKGQESLPSVTGVQCLECEADLAAPIISIEKIIGVRCVASM